VDRHGDVVMTSSAAEQLPPSELSQEPAESRDFDSIYQAHFDFVWRSLQALGVPPAAAEDAAQDTFVVVHRRMGDLLPSASVKAWLFAIAVRVAHDYRRTARRRGASPLEDADREVSTAVGPFERTAKAQAVQLVERFLTQLDADKRAVFVMSEVQEMTAPEIAAALEVNLNTVYARLRAARERFACFVRERVAALVAGGMAAGLASKTLAQKVVGSALALGIGKAGLFSSVGAKLAVATAVVVTAGTLTVASVRPDTPAAPQQDSQQRLRRQESKAGVSAVAHDRVARPEVRVATADRVATGVPTSQRNARARKQHASPPDPETLQAEMLVLKRASSALFRGEASTAHVILASYRSTFPRPKLQEEHDGLRVMADCLQHRVGAGQRARHFLLRAPGSVLASRVAHACGLGD
jgi:RNA polymerase sigma-70 factor (ECF subfamily)